MSKKKKQTGGLSELAKTLDNFVEIFEANTLPTQDGGRSIDPYGFGGLNDFAKILVQSLSIAYDANIPQGKVIFKNKKEGITLHRAALDAEQRDIIFQISRALIALMPTKKADGLSPGIDHTNPLKPEQIFSAEAVARLKGSAMMLKGLVGNSKREKKELISRKGKALIIAADNPQMSIREIADEVKLNYTTLYRCKEFMAVFNQNKKGRFGQLPPPGSKDDEGNIEGIIDKEPEYNE